MRHLVAVLAFACFVRLAAAKPPVLSATGATGLTYNDNITLSKDDVNFGPGVLSASDLLGVVRVRTQLKLDDTDLVYNGSRTHFFKNGDLGFVENSLELTHTQRYEDEFLLTGQATLARVDPDLLVKPDQNGRFPFTTSEPPDRQVYQLIAATAPGRPTDVSLRALAQDQQYGNNPLLNSSARAVQLHAGQKIDAHWAAAVEVQGVTRDYPNLVGPTPGSIVQTKPHNEAVQATYVPNKHFGFLLKSLWLEQRANVDAFFLSQQDLSLAASYDQEKLGNVSLLVQRSAREFARRPAPGGGSQSDRDLLVLLQLTHPLGPRGSAVIAFTRDHNQSNVPDFDYSNNIVRIELSRSF